MKKIFLLSILAFSHILSFSQTMTNTQIGYGSSANTATTSASLTYSNNILRLSTPVPAAGSYNEDYDPVVVVARTTATASTINAHTYVDATVFNKSSDSLGYVAFIDTSVIEGSVNYDHHATFQTQFNYNGTGTMQELYGYLDVSYLNSGTVKNRNGIYVADPLGSGKVENNYGIYIKPLSRGSKNFALWTDGSTPSMFGGNVFCAEGMHMYNYSGSVGSESKLYFTHDSIARNTSTISDDLRSGYSIMKFTVSGGGSWAPITILQLNGQTGKAIVTKLNISSIPTSPAGLVSGDVYSASGVLKIVP